MNAFLAAQEVRLLNRWQAPLLSFVNLGVILLLLALNSTASAQVAAEVSGDAKQDKAIATETHEPVKAIDEASRPIVKDKTLRVKKEDKAAHSVARTFSITVSGNAVDQQGKPIVGAQIYLASPRTNSKPLAITKTDNSGTYRFEKVPLAIKPADTNAGQDVGSFEVFGRAEGFGLAWRPLKWFYPDSAHVNGVGSDLTWDLPDRFGHDDHIELDLHFGPAATLRGRVVDDFGEPIAGASLAIRRGKPWDDNRSLRNLESLNESALVPTILKLSKSDEKGRFEFRGLPVDHVFWIDVRPANYSPRMISAATREGLENDESGEPIYSGEFEVVFPRPHKVKLRVVYGDSGQPAVKVGVGGIVSKAGFWETTDDNGIVEVPLPNDRYELGIYPKYGTPYLKTDADLVVSDVTKDQTTTLRLNPAAVMDITVLDADTGKPLSGVDVWLDEKVPGIEETRRRVHGYRSWEVETRISHYDAPRSDKNGSMQVLFQPGKHRFGVGLEAYPKGYKPVEIDGKELECEAGKPTKVEFHMRRK